MKYTVERLMEHPGYFHRVLEYVFRNTRFADDFGMGGEEVEPDGGHYWCIGCSYTGTTPQKTENDTGRRNAQPQPQTRRRFGLIAYINDFEMLKHRHKQYGRSGKIWDEVDKSENEATFAECSDDYTKIMLFLNFSEREDYYRKFIQHQIGIFGRSTDLPAEERKAVVADIKKNSREYLDQLTNQIYNEIFYLIATGPRELLTKKQEDWSRFSQLIDDNRSVMDLWWKTSGRHYNHEYQRKIQQYVDKNTTYPEEDYEKARTWHLKHGWKNFSKETYQNYYMSEAKKLTAVFVRGDNIMFSIPQLSSYNDKEARCLLGGLADIDTVPIFQFFLDEYKQDHMDAFAQTEVETTAQRGAN